MARDAATEFLKRKRAEQQQRQQGQFNINITLAPSPYDRYGLTGMGDRPLQSGKYTGPGPDGQVQPTMPTERRISANGRPYAVDEGEVLVLNAETVQAYGGPEALDNFIQSNKPGAGPRRAVMPQQMACGGMPDRMTQYSRGGIPGVRDGTGPLAGTAACPYTGQTERPYDRQLNILNEINRGMPRMEGGGIMPIANIDEARRRREAGYAVASTLNSQLTPPAATPPLTLPAAGIESAIRAGVTSGAIPAPIASAPVLTAPPTTAPRTTETALPVMPIANIDAARTIRNATYNPPTMSAVQGSQQSNLIHNPPTMSAVQGSQASNTVMPIAQIDEARRIREAEYATPIMPIQQIDQARREREAGIMPIQAIDEARREREAEYARNATPATPPAAGSPAVSASTLDQMILDQYLSRQAGMNESERAGEAQRLMQQGVTPEAMRGMQAVSDVSRRSALGTATAEYGTQAAAREEQRGIQAESVRQFNIGQENTEKDFDESKRRWDAQFGIEQSNQMANDAGTMTKETWLAKYGSMGMTRADYDIAKKAADVRLGVSGQAMTQAAGYLSNAIMQNPGFDWTSDASAKAYLENAWKEQGSPGDFTQWANNYVGGLKTTAGTATVNALKNEAWYTSAPDLGAGVYKDPSGQYTKAFYDELLFPALSIQTQFPGLTWGLDENNNLVLKDTTTGTNIDVTTGGTTVTTGDTQAAAFKSFTDTYDIPNFDRGWFDAFYASKGRAPNDDEELATWSLNNRSFTTDATGLKQADYVITASGLDIDTTNSSLSQWLKANDGKLPTSEKEWENWSKTDRVYSADDSVDVAAAQLSMAALGFKNVDDAEQVGAYLAQNGGKIGTASQWNSWVGSNPTASDSIAKLTASEAQAGLLVGQRSDTTGKGNLIISPNEALAIVNDPAGSAYIENPNKWTYKAAKDFVQDIYGKAIQINGKWYVATAYGGSPGQGDDFTLLDLQTGQPINVKIAQTADQGYIYVNNKPVIGFTNSTMVSIENGRPTPIDYNASMEYILAKAL